MKAPKSRQSDARKIHMPILAWETPVLEFELRPGYGS
jgi:hypothetical protein